MRRILIIMAITALMLLGLTTVSIASTVYFDYLACGESDNSFWGDDDATGSAFGFIGQFPKFNIGLEYIDGSMEMPSSPVSYDFTAYDLRGGFALVNTDNVKFYLGLGYISCEYIKDIYTFNGFEATVDFIGVWDKFMFEGDLGYTINGTLDESDLDSTIIYYKLRFTYLVNENAGLTLAYRNINTSTDDGFPDCSFAGISLGFTYKF